MERRTVMTSALIFAVATFILWGTNNFLMSYAENKYALGEIDTLGVTLGSPALVRIEG